VNADWQRKDGTIRLRSDTTHFRKGHSHDLQARCEEIAMKLRNPKPPYNMSQLF